MSSPISVTQSHAAATDAPPGADAPRLPGFVSSIVGDRWRAHGSL